MALSGAGTVQLAGKSEHLPDWTRRRVPQENTTQSCQLPRRRLATPHAWGCHHLNTFGANFVVVSTTSSGLFGTAFTSTTLCSGSWVKTHTKKNRDFILKLQNGFWYDIHMAAIESATTGGSYHVDTPSPQPACTQLICCGNKRGWRGAHTLPRAPCPCGSACPACVSVRPHECSDWSDDNTVRVVCSDCVPDVRWP
jgi:hypothetical protein